MVTGLSAIYLLLQNAPTPGSPQWFTTDTLFTAAGSTAAVITVTTVLQRLIPNFPARWFGLVLSLVLALLAISVRHSDWSVVNIFLATLNGLVTFAAAVGVNTAATAPPIPPLGVKAITGRSYRWYA